MKDAKGHGSNPRGARDERVKLNKQLDQRKVEPPSTRRGVRRGRNTRLRCRRRS